MPHQFTIGLDYGTNSVRALVVDVADGSEWGTAVWEYATGDHGIVVDDRDPNLARQHPRDYLAGIGHTVKGALAEAAGRDGFDPANVIGIGVDTTGSTPIPVGEDGRALAEDDRWAENPAALAWLWKDHTSVAEAEEITALAARMRPQYLAKIGNTYSSEWYWAKLLRCRRVAPDVFDAAASWVELCDWVPAVLSGTEHPSTLKRGVCAAAHKAMYHTDWGYPDAAFLGALDPALVRVRETLPERAHTVADAAGQLTEEWASALGLPAGIPVAVGAFDAHLGAVGSGIRPGVLVKIMGTSTCDMAVAPMSDAVADIPGVCGVAPESILPGHHGVEAGQSAVGDIFNWFVRSIQPAAGGHAELTAQAEKLAPGESGLLALDWHNGNRTILVDQRLTGALLGMTLHTAPAEMYRAWVEATAFGARMILDRIAEYGVQVSRVVTCGGISAKNAMVMQVYADILGRPVEISRSGQTCALGSAVAAAVVAGAHPDFDAATAAMTGIADTRFEPNPAAVAVYDRLFALYRQVHDAFGTREAAGNHFDVMKELIAIRDEARRARGGN